MNKVDIQIAQIQIDRTAASNVAKAVPKQIEIQINSKHENRSMPFLSFWLTQELEITKKTETPRNDQLHARLALCAKAH